MTSTYNVFYQSIWYTCICIKWIGILTLNVSLRSATKLSQRFQFVAGVGQGVGNTFRSPLAHGSCSLCALGPFFSPVNYISQRAPLPAGRSVLPRRAPSGSTMTGEFSVILLILRISPISSDGLASAGTRSRRYHSVRDTWESVWSGRPLGVLACGRL